MFVWGDNGRLTLELVDMPQTEGLIKRPLFPLGYSAGKVLPQSTWIFKKNEYKGGDIVVFPTNLGIRFGGKNCLVHNEDVVARLIEE